MRWFARFGIVLFITVMCVLGLQAPVNASGGYDGNRAAAWAIAHAQDSQPGFNGCAWYASQALWIGGMSEDAYWNGHDVFRGLYRGDWGTRDATLASDLFNYLKYSEKALVIPLAGYHARYDRFAPGQSAVPEARLGDLIAYDWDGDGEVTHMSVVVHISAGNYPDVAEWGTAGGAGMRAAYVWRGWTWSENGHAWLRERYPRVTAYLLHIQ